MAAVQAAKAPSDGFGLVGTTLEGKYRVDRVVAEGGFGVVYAGHHCRLKVPVAIKVLKTLAHLPEKDRERATAEFLREAETVAGLQHPHVVAAIDVGVSPMPVGGPAPWMVLQWLTGITLQTDLEQRRARSEPGRTPAEAIALLRPVIDAVAQAHDARVAHRDLKPANIMLVTTSRGVVPYVLDFGIAKVMELDDDAGSGATQTDTAAPAFSPRYAAPEQVAGTRTGPWTDVHALGLVLTEVITGTEAYSARSRAALCAQVLSHERPSPSALGFDVGPYELVLRRALAFRPDERYANAGALLAALESAPGSVEETSPAPAAPAPVPSTAAVVEPEPLTETGPAVVATAPTSLPPTAASAARRRRFVGAAVVGVAALAAAVVSWSGYVPHDPARDAPPGPAVARPTPRVDATPPVLAPPEAAVVLASPQGPSVAPPQGPPPVAPRVESIAVRQRAPTRPVGPRHVAVVDAGVAPPARPAAPSNPDWNPE